MATNLYQNGETISHAAAGAVASGQAVAIGTVIGIAREAAGAGEMNEYLTEGVYLLPNPTVTLAQGDVVNIDAAGAIAAAGTAAGIAWAASTGGTDVTAPVKINVGT